jgi:septal ring factor EnvC (AmiA/AmiB activator)
MRVRSRGVIALIAAISTSLAGAAPPDVAEPPLSAGQEFAPLEVASAAVRLTAIDARLSALEEQRANARVNLARREEDRQAEGRRARRLAREILLSELHGHALASTPRELVANATMRSGLRRVAARTLEAHGARAKEADEARAAIAALDLDEAKLRGERVGVESAVRLEQEEARRRRDAFQHIFEADGREPSFAGGHARVRVAEAGDDEGETGDPSFRTRRGKLPLPVQRKCRIKSKRSEEFGGAYLAIRSSKPSNVRAVGEGSVAFADELAPYGKLVVVDHGEGYFTVYGGLTRIATAVGATLREGGLVGSLDADAQLVFQLRSGTRNLAAVTWFAQGRSAKGADGAPP